MVLELIGAFAAGAAGSFALWYFYGVPRVRRAFQWEAAKLICAFAGTVPPPEDEPIDLVQIAANAREAVLETSVQSVKDALPDVSAMLKAELPSLIDELAPVLIDGLVSHTQSFLGQKSVVSRNLAKDALEGGNLQALMQDPQIQELAKQFEAQMGGKGTGLPAVAQNPLLQLVPRQWRGIASAILTLRGQGGGVPMLGGGGAPTGNGGFQLR